MQKRVLGALTTAVCLLSLTACGNRMANQAANQANQAANKVANTAVTPRNSMATPGRPGAPAATEARLAVEQDIARHVVKVAHVRNASVFVAGRTAYVAVELNPGVHTGLAQATKDRIISAVKQRHPQIQTVYVSANPDAYQQFQKFAADLQHGRPVSAIWNQFTSVVQRIWPNAR
jgi:YhcN/YlaJ family sporulation lipoprotein